MLLTFKIQIGILIRKSVNIAVLIFCNAVLQDQGKQVLFNLRRLELAHLFANGLEGGIAACYKTGRHLGHAIKIVQQGIGFFVQIGNDIHVLHAGKIGYFPLGCLAEIIGIFFNVVFLVCTGNQRDHVFCI